MTFTNYRQFGMEFECFNEAVLHRQSAQNIETAIRGLGFPAKAQFSHWATEYDKWQIKPDSTVGRDTGRSQYGLEVVSRTLPGTQASLDEVTKVVRWMSGNGYDVDQTCGYHIHIDAGDLSSYECAAVALRYHHRQQEINAVLPSSRHPGNCRWAQRLSGSALNKVNNTVINQSRTERWNDDERYVSVNLQHVRKARADRRIEFRQHSGTVNASKAIGWYKFLCDFIAETLKMVRANGGSVAPTVTGSPIVRRQSTRRGQTRSVVVGTTSAPVIPRIEAGTDYDRFLQTIMQNGIITTDDARSFGWMNGGTNARNSRLRVTAHWLRRHGAELITTEHNGELAYVGRNGARTMAEIFTAPAQIRRRVTTPVAVSTANAIAPAAATGAAQRALLDKLAATPLLDGMSDESVEWYNARRADFARRP